MSIGLRKDMPWMSVLAEASVIFLLKRNGLYQVELYMRKDYGI